MTPMGEKNDNAIKYTNTEGALNAIINACSVFSIMMLKIGDNKLLLNQIK